MRASSVAHLTSYIQHPSNLCKVSHPFVTSPRLRAPSYHLRVSLLQIQVTDRAASAVQHELRAGQPTTARLLKKSAVFNETRRFTTVLTTRTPIQNSQNHVHVFLTRQNVSYTAPSKTRVFQPEKNEVRSLGYLNAEELAS